MPQIHLKKNEATEIVFPMVDKDNPETFKTGETVTDTAYYKEGAGAWTTLSITDTVSEIGSTGVYELSLTAGEMNYDLVIIKFTATSSQDTFLWIKTYTRDIDDIAYPATSGRSIQVESDGMVHADVKEWLASAPNALQSGRIDGYVGAMGSGVVTAAAVGTGAIDADAIGADAITAAKIADDAIAAEHIATGAIVAATFAAGAINAAAVATGAIDADAIASNAITSAKIATDAIGSDEFAQAAADKVWSTAARALTDKAGFTISGTKQTLDALNDITAGAAADAVWDEDATGHQSQGTFGQAIGDPGSDSDTIWALCNSYLDAAISSRSTFAGGAVASVTGNVGGNVTGSVGSVTGNVGGNVTGSIGSVATGGIVAASFAAGAIDASAIAANAITSSEFAQSAADKVWDTAARALTDKTGFSLAADQSAVTVGTVNALAANSVDASALATDAVSEIANAIIPQKNAAFSNLVFLMVNSTDHVTPETGLTVAAYRSIDGGSFSAGTASAPTEIGNGIYQYDPSQADMNGDVIMFRFSASGADDRFIFVKTSA